MDITIVKHIHNDIKRKLQAQSFTAAAFVGSRYNILEEVNKWVKYAENKTVNFTKIIVLT